MAGGGSAGGGRGGGGAGGGASGYKRPRSPEPVAMDLEEDSPSPPRGRDQDFQKQDFRGERGWVVLLIPPPVSKQQSKTAYVCCTSLLPASRGGRDKGARGAENCSVL